MARVIAGEARGAGPGGPPRHVGLPGGEFSAVLAARLRGRAPCALADGGVGASPPRGALSGHAWLARGPLVIVERAPRSGPVSWPAGVQPDRARRYGEATFWYGRAPYNLLAEP